MFTRNDRQQSAPDALSGRYPRHIIHIQFLDSASHPALQGLAIVIGTFILEDAATVLAAMRTASGKIPMSYALGALYIGISLGDLGLYGLGRLSRRLSWLSQVLPHRRTGSVREWFSGRLGVIVVTSRFVPGLRLPTYTALGYLGVPFGRFAGYVVLATLVWTSLLFGISLSFGTMILAHLGAWRWAGIAGFTLAVVLIGRAVSRSALADR